MKRSDFQYIESLFITVVNLALLVLLSFLDNWLSWGGVLGLILYIISNSFFFIRRKNKLEMVVFILMAALAISIVVYKKFVLQGI